MARGGSGFRRGLAAGGFGSAPASTRPWRPAWRRSLCASTSAPAAAEPACASAARSEDPRVPPVTGKHTRLAARTWTLCGRPTNGKVRSGEADEQVVTLCSACACRSLCLLAPMESADPVPHFSPGLFGPVHISGLAGRGLTCLPSRRIVPCAIQWQDEDPPSASRGSYTLSLPGDVPNAVGFELM